MKTFYLVLSILGAVIPYLFFIHFIEAQGLNLSLFLASLFANSPAGGFTADLLIASLIFWIYMFRRLKKSGGPHPAVFIVLNLLIGLGCAFPAYLYSCERQQENTRK